MSNFRHVFAIVAATLLVGCAGQQPSLNTKAAKTGVHLSHIWGVPGTGTLDVWLLDVGQGSCTYIACPDQHSALLIDCGSSAAGGTPLSAVRDWLNTKISQSSTTVVVSHPDKDHMSLLADDEVAAEPVAALLIGRTLEHYPPAFRTWAEKVRTSPQTFNASETTANDNRFACSPAQVDLLTANSTMDPATGDFGGSKNADSIVMRVRWGTSSIIITGDAEGSTEQRAIDNAAAQETGKTDTSLLLGSHHGARTHGSNGQAWLETTRPRAVAYSARLASSYHHPQCEVVQRASQFADPLTEAFDFSCGIGNADVSFHRVSARLLSTHINGHVLVQYSDASVRYLCQRMSPACDETLSEELIPR